MGKGGSGNTKYMNPEAVAGYMSRLVEIMLDLEGARGKLRELAETAMSDSGSESPEVYHGAASQELAVYYENLYLHINKMINFSGMGGKYMGIAMKEVADMDRRLADCILNSRYKEH